MLPNKRKSNKKMIFDFDIFGFLRALINSQKLAKIKKSCQINVLPFWFLRLNQPRLLIKKRKSVCLHRFNFVGPKIG